MNTNTFGDTTIEIHGAGEASPTAADTQAICAALVASYEDTDSLGWQAGTDAMTAAGKTRATALAVQAATRDHLTAAARAMVAAIPLVAAAPEFREYAQSEEELEVARAHLIATAMAVSTAEAIAATVLAHDVSGAGAFNGQQSGWPHGSSS